MMKPQLKRLSLPMLIAAAFAVAGSAMADEVKRVPLLDESGRELVPGGYVVLEDIPYTADDYHRMVRMGANFQVIRMPMTVIPLILDNLQRQAALSRAPLLLGEWDSPTRAGTDTNVAEQARFTDVYQFTANQMDQRGIGGIKPWFCGTRRMIPLGNARVPVTWAIFSDASPAGLEERQYLVDVLVRPRPLVVAGRVKDYGNDFSTLTFEMKLQTASELGGSEIFVPAERHYANGFRVELGADLTLDHHPGDPAFRLVQAKDAVDQEQA